MRLIGGDGYGVELGVVGYQFPDAVNPQQRRSWLVITGTAHSPQGSWSFRWQALTPEDAVALAQWLYQASDLSVDTERRSARMSFTEPNLTFSYATAEASLIDLTIGLDLEFSPPWRRRTRAGDPFVISCRIDAESVSTAGGRLGSRDRLVSILSGARRSSTKHTVLPHGMHGGGFRTAACPRLQYASAVPRIRFRNPHADRPFLLCVEPFVEEYWLRPGDTFTIEFDESDRAEQMIGDADFDVSWYDFGIFVWIASWTDVAVLDESGAKLEHGHQRPRVD